ncbi:hypothetical protein [Haloechinothrix sp. LS1_15]|uniref:hypothetical protein n=1 Tax=Haloechinothrix sp. LS1_15 TaxID=2652248 RepID=UPI00294839B7|nr:hypothetical protein [Haloechinothrix sp. LS1_15]MDV6013394.1 hypothetical protein [Haloechinothrix sp. LS1_15]
MRRLRELDLPEPFHVDAFRADLSRRTGRPIQLLALGLPPGSPCGLWLSTESTEYVIYQRDTDPLHREHIILHELSHLCCDHRASTVLSEELSRSLFSHLDDTLVRSVLGRSHYTLEQEREAELMASLILHRRRGRTRRFRQSHTTASEPAEDATLSADADAAVIARIERTLQQPGRDWA